jgi:hypothetical protein
MPYLARSVAVVCAPAMAIVSRLLDSADDRRERARLSELNRLRRQFEGPDERPPQQERTSTA